MNKEIAKKWVEALRSGKYPQGTGRMCAKGPGKQKSFCCLGVLCDIVKDEIGGEWVHNTACGELIFSTGTEKGMAGLYLPREVCDFAGIENSAGRFVKNGRAEFLAYENDTGSSFAQIADIIEAHAEEL